MAKKHKHISSKGFEPSENKFYMRAMQDLRRGSAASPHVLKKHKGARGENARNAIRDSQDK